MRGGGEGGGSALMMVLKSRPQKLENMGSNPHHTGNVAKETEPKDINHCRLLGGWAPKL